MDGLIDGDDGECLADRNATSRALVSEMKAKFGSTPSAAHIEHDDSIDCYVKVMGQDGIYGTSLEVEALADYLKVPIVCVIHHVHHPSITSTNTVCLRLILVVCIL
jgi:hypothetical protein